MHKIKNNNANNCRLAVWKQWNVSKLMCVQCLLLLGVEKLEILSTRKLEGSLQVTAIVDRTNIFIMACLTTMSGFLEQKSSKSSCNLGDNKTFKYIFIHTHTKVYIFNWKHTNGAIPHPLSFLPKYSWVVSYRFSINKVTMDPAFSISESFEWRVLWDHVGAAWLF